MPPHNQTDGPPSSIRSAGVIPGNTERCTKDSLYVLHLEGTTLALDKDDTKDTYVEKV